MPVGRDLVFEIEQFLYREARLLDDERYDEWLALMAPDIHYRMPGIQARYRADKGEVISVFNLRHRNEMEEQTLSARRRDVIRRDVTGALKLARRLIRLQQTVLQAKNINTFL